MYFIGEMDKFMNLLKQINNIKSCIEKRRNDRHKIEESIYNLQKKIYELERKYERLERKKEGQLVLSETSINRICNSIESKRNINLNDVNKDVSFKRRESIISIISLLISIVAVLVSIITATNQIKMDKLSEKVIISCEYFQEETQLIIHKENGIYEYVNVNYIPVFFTSFAIETEDDGVLIPKEPIPININEGWQNENVNQSSQTILMRDIKEWNDEYYPKLRTITEYFNNRMASVIQLGYIIKIDYFDTINEEKCAKYYKLVTNVYDESKTHVSIDVVSRYDTYEIKEIDEDEAESIFDNKCVLSIMNEVTWPIDFLNKYEGK